MKMCEFDEKGRECSILTRGETMVLCPSKIKVDVTIIFVCPLLLFLVVLLVVMDIGHILLKK